MIVRSSPYSKREASACHSAALRSSGAAITGRTCSGKTDIATSLNPRQYRRKTSSPRRGLLSITG